jgi:ribosomal protein L35
MKTNKSLTKRLKVTKNGKIKARKSGIGHFNAKMSRRKQLGQRTENDFVIKPKAKSLLMPFSKY